MMKKEGEILMSGMSILGLCLVAIGLLTIAYGGAEFGFGLSLDFQSYLIGGFISILIGAILIPGMAIAGKLLALALVVISIVLYIHSMPDLEFLLQLMSDVVVIGFAAFLALFLLRK